MVSPDPVFQLIGSLMAAKQLLVANELDLFEHLAAGPLALEELATAVGAPARTLRITADALVSIGMLERQAERYANSAVTQAYLSGDKSSGLRPVLRLWNKLVYPKWERLEEAIRTGKATLGELTPEEQRIFSLGVERLTAKSAEALATGYDFSQHQRVLDIGGGTGSFLRAIRQQHGQLELTLFEQPRVIKLIRELAGQEAAQLPMRLVEGNLFKDALPEDQDVIILSNVVHLFSPEHNHALFRRIHAAAPAGARLLLVDFWTDPTHTQPAFAALIAGEFQLVTGEGDVYSQQEAASWLEATGWKPLEHRPLAGAASLVVAEKVPEAA